MIIKVFLLIEHFYYHHHYYHTTKSEGGVPSKVAVWVSERVDEFDLDACNVH